MSTAGSNIIETKLAPTPDDILEDPTRSRWIKAAVQDLMKRDPLDAFNDAVELRNVMERRFGEAVVKCDT